MKLNNKKMIVTGLFTLLPAVYGLMRWNDLPDQMPFHWNMQGAVDGYCSKAFAVFGLPLIMFGIHILCGVATALDPKNKKQNAKMVGLIYYIAPVICIAVSAAMYVYALSGKNYFTTDTPLLLVGVMFMVVGNYMPKCTPSYTIGIKLPWTLDDEDTWYATHRFAGKLWFAAGALVLVCALLPTPYDMWVSLPLMLVAAFVPMVYSYRYYKNKQ